MATLPEQLEHLEAAVTRGGRHGALGRATPAEANAIVARHRPRARRREVVKVKSMVTDEIGLNDALAEAGHRGASETDLAELIVQLADDRPSHILVPAIHRNRAEIRGSSRATIADEQDARADPAELAEVAPLAPARDGS